jgi:hypothetical protein
MPSEEFIEFLEDEKIDQEKQQKILSKKSEQAFAQKIILNAQEQEHLAEKGSTLGSRLTRY